MEYDLTRPNSGRLLDYWLGGDHNFEIDRQLARQLESNMPVVVEMARSSRSLVKRCVEYFYARGIRAIIDFGSSLPTCENTHQVAHALDPNIKVVYSDIDPITVAYSQELLHGTPNALYLQANAANPREVLDHPETIRLLGNDRRVGFVFLNLAHMLGEDQLRAAWRTLYDWAAPGSFLAASNASEHWETDPTLAAIGATFKRSSQPFYGRTPAQFSELASPWQITVEGVHPNTTWGIPNPPPITQRVGHSAMFFK